MNNPIYYIPNILSISRIVASILLLFFFDNLKAFIPLYLFAGISDILDGFLARRFKVESSSGARLDSIGDTFFFIILLVYLFIAQQDIMLRYIIPIIAIAAVKLSSILIGLIKFRKLTMLHTIANKATGLLVYLIPLFIWLGVNQFITFIIVIALLAATEEMIILIKSPRNYIEINRKGLFIH